MIRSLIFYCTLAVILSTGSNAQDQGNPVPAGPEQVQEELKSHPATLGAREIMQRADAAAKKVKGVQYSFRAQRIDVPDRVASKMSGKITMSGWKGSLPEKFRFEVETRPGGRDESARVIVGFDGSTFWALNMRDKKALSGPTIEAIGVYQLLVRFVPVTEFVLPEPFGDELRAQELEVLGETEVDGSPCFQVHVVYKNPGQEATWFISRDDYLPRRVDRRILDPEGATLTRRSEIAHLVTEPELKDEEFAFKLPEGFTLVDSGEE